MTGASLHHVFDRNLVARHRDRAMPDFEHYAFLLRRESTEFFERLADVSRTFETALDLGSHDGTLAEGMTQNAQVGTAMALELAPGLAAKTYGREIPTVQGDEEKLPFAPASFDLIGSILSLHWVNDLPGTLVQARLALKPDGLFLGCLFGAGTLRELRLSLIEAETALAGGAAARISPLPGLQDMASLLQRAGFALPVADVDTITVRYADPLRLLHDLRGMGEQAAFASNGDNRPPLSRRLLAAMREAYFDQFADKDGKVRATFEIIWLSGWAPASDQPQPLKPGSARASLADAVKKAARKD